MSRFCSRCGAHRSAFGWRFIVFFVGASMFAAVCLLAGAGTLAKWPAAGLAAVTAVIVGWATRNLFSCHECRQRRRERHRADERAEARAEEQAEADARRHAREHADHDRDGQDHGRRH